MSGQLLVSASKTVRRHNRGSYHSTAISFLGSARSQCFPSQLKLGRGFVGWLFSLLPARHLNVTLSYLLSPLVPLASLPPRAISLPRPCCSSKLKTDRGLTFSLPSARHLIYVTLPYLLSPLVHLAFFHSPGISFPRQCCPRKLKTDWGSGVYFSFCLLLVTSSM